MNASSPFNPLPIIIGVVCGVLGLLLIVVIYCIWRHNKKSRQELETLELHNHKPPPVMSTRGASFVDVEANPQTKSPPPPLPPKRSSSSPSPPPPPPRSVAPVSAPSSGARPPVPPRPPSPRTGQFHRGGSSGSQLRTAVIVLALSCICLTPVSSQTLVPEVPSIMFGDCYTQSDALSADPCGLCVSKSSSCGFCSSGVSRVKTMYTNTNQWVGFERNMSFCAPANSLKFTALSGSFVQSATNTVQWEMVCMDAGAVPTRDASVCHGSGSALSAMLHIILYAGLGGLGGIILLIVLYCVCVRSRQKRLAELKAQRGGLLQQTTDYVALQPENSDD